MINIDYERDKLLSEAGIATVMDRYKVGEEKSPQESFARAAEAFSDDEAHAQRIYDYASKRWFMFSSPILSNAGTKRGLPISCFLNYVEDSLESISKHWDENVWLASRGGGIGGYWGNIRSVDEVTSRGSKSNGAIPFLKVVDAQMPAISQGITRRGAYAAYLDINHPEIEEFINLRKNTGDMNRKCLNLHHGINITDDFMEAVENGSQFNLLSPKTKEVIKTVDAREIFQRIIETRLETGEPYLHFIDESNRQLPYFQQALGLKIHQSNLCSEIILPTNESRTAVCCLSSVNLETWDEWKDDTLFIRDLIIYLDNVLDAFIKRASMQPGMEKAVTSARRERSLGLGAMGFHSLLQKKGIAWESALARSLNMKIFKHIKDQAEEATVVLGAERGNCPDFEFGTADMNYSVPRRNAHLIAIAPNATSGIICNSSPSIEPFPSNIFVQKTDSGSFVMKNKYLDKLIKDLYDEETYDKIWSDISANGGSIQNLSYFDQDTKDVYKTGFELDQRYVIQHAVDRQEYIDQAQSLNLFFTPDAHKGYMTECVLRAWKGKLKTLYYVRSKPIKNAERVNWTLNQEECVSCSG